MKISVKRHAVTQPLDQSYRLIPLTQNQTVIVDAEDFERLDRWNWTALFLKHRNSFVAGRCDENNKTILMHREILSALPKES
jgi:hypothetical protein